MSETLLLLADPHFTSDVKDLYRWDIFSWLKDQIKKYGIDKLIILSDLTERKDKHDAQLVNRLVNEVTNLTQYCDIVVLKGNHDYIDKDTPFFGFLHKIKGINFITYPVKVGKYLFLPHSKNPVEDWKNVSLDVDYIFMHQCISGTRLNDSYFVKDGFDAKKFFKDFEGIGIYSGDIHVPQEIDLGNDLYFNYVGAPYPIYFGDIYDGQVLIIKNGKTSKIPYPSFKKWSLKINNISELEESDVKNGDWLKLEFFINKVDFYLIEEFRKAVKTYCELNNIKLCSLEFKPVRVDVNKSIRVRKNVNKEISNEEVLKRFALKEKLDNEFVMQGLEILNG